MWINFESNGFFAVKVIVDGMNAVSGELSTDSLSTDLRRIALLYENSSIQDYIVAGTLGQRCLDGGKIKGDKIMQFVAAQPRIRPSHRQSNRRSKRLTVFVE